MNDSRGTGMLAGIGDVAATSLITLYCHAIETRSDNPILADAKSVEIAAELDKTLSRSEQPLARALVSRTLDKNLVIHIAIRAKKYDEYVRGFLSRYPDGVIVNIGCGLDSRFLRTDNGRVVFYDLDLPEIIAIKNFFLLNISGITWLRHRYWIMAGWRRSTGTMGRSCSWQKECSCILTGRMSGRWCWRGYTPPPCFFCRRGRTLFAGYFSGEGHICGKTGVLRMAGQAPRGRRSPGDATTGRCRVNARLNFKKALPFVLRLWVMIAGRTLSPIRGVRYVFWNSFFL